MNLLLDHKADENCRVIRKVVLLGHEEPAGSERWDRARTILIMLSEPRPRARARSNPPAISRQRCRKNSLPTMFEESELEQAILLREISRCSSLEIT